MTSVDFAIITALPEELRAVCAALGTVEEVHREDADIRYYYRSSLTSRDGAPIHVVCACATEMGQQPLGNLTRDVIAAWQPRHLLLVGIAGGFPTRSVTHGDLIVPTQVHYYEPGKTVRLGTEEQHIPRWRTFRASKRLLSAVDALALETPVTWLHRVTEARPSAADPRILRGDLASGEEVWASLRGPAAQEVLQRSDKILAIENEAAGMCSAVEELPNAPDVLIVKGISDLVEGKSDHWRAFAASAAAAFVVALIEKVGARWKKDGPDPDAGLKAAWDAMNDGHFEEAALLAESAASVAEDDVPLAVRCHRQAIQSWGETVATGHLDEDALREAIGRIRAGIEAIAGLQPDAPFLALERARLALFERDGDGAREHALAALRAAEEDSVDWVDALIFFHHSCWLREAPEETLQVEREMGRACALDDPELRLVALTTRLRTLLKTGRATVGDMAAYCGAALEIVDMGLGVKRVIEVTQQVAWDLRRDAAHDQRVLLSQLRYDLATRAKERGLAGGMACETAELLAVSGASPAETRRWLGLADSCIAQLRDEPEQAREWATLTALAFFTKGRIAFRFGERTTDREGAREQFTEAAATLEECDTFAATHAAAIKGDITLFLAEVRSWRGRAQFELGRPAAAATLFAQVHYDAALGNEQFARHVASSAWLAEAENLCLSGQLDAAARTIDAMVADPRAKAWWPQAQEFQTYLANHLRPTVDWLSSADAHAVTAAARRTSLREALATQLQPLLRWWKVWSPHNAAPYTELLDFWARGGFLRLVAAIRGRPHAAIAVDARTIDEIRLWARVLCPLFETVVIKWKGDLGAGLVIVPMDMEYGGPGAAGGHGYTVCSDDVRAPDGSKWTTAVGWANPLPSEVAGFLATEALRSSRPDDSSYFPHLSLAARRPRLGGRIISSWTACSETSSTPCTSSRRERHHRNACWIYPASRFRMSPMFPCPT
jgi:nucleoside phosphorylase